MKFRLILRNVSLLAYMTTSCVAFGLRKRGLAKINFSLLNAHGSRRDLIASTVTSSAVCFVQQISTSLTVLASDVVVDYSKIY
jgi:hypothetical protein